MKSLHWGTNFFLFIPLLENRLAWPPLGHCKSGSLQSFPSLALPLPLILAQALPLILAQALPPFPPLARSHLLPLFHQLYRGRGVVAEQPDGFKKSLLQLILLLWQLFALGQTIDHRNSSKTNYVVQRSSSTSSLDLPLHLRSAILRWRSTM